jgi:hypothetical protein
LRNHAAYQKQWRRDNLEKARATEEKSRAKHAAAIKLRDKARHDAVKQMLTNAKARAKHFVLPFSITREDIIVPEFCPILGHKLQVRGGRTAPSLDRIVPALGYVPGNIQVISHMANTMKSDATLEEMIHLGKWAQEQIKCR